MKHLQVNYQINKTQTNFVDFVKNDMLELMSKELLDNYLKEIETTNISPQMDELKIQLYTSSQTELKELWEVLSRNKNRIDPIDWKKIESYFGIK